jgi:hypothetical protein
MSSVVIAGNTSGTITLDAPNVAGTTVLTLPTANGTVLTTANVSSNLPAGSVLQVLQTIKTDTWSNATQNTWNDVTGLSVSITPSSSSNKILVIGNINYAAGSNTYYRIVRGSTEICVGDTAGSRISATGSSGYNSADGNVGKTGAFNYLDSPSTTSSTTYKIQVFGFNTTQYVNRVETDTNSGVSARGASTIIVMEIKG